MQKILPVFAADGVESQRDLQSAGLRTVKTQMKNPVPEGVGADLVLMGRFNLQVHNLLIGIVMRYGHP